MISLGTKPAATPPLQPGIIALQSNQTESLAQALVAWLQKTPLGPLEEEVILVQSNAMAEWVKMVVAEQGGVCAAVRVELPARFMWRTYRQVLGRSAVPLHSPLDKLPLGWRLMALLPQCLDEPAFAPVASFLAPDCRARLYPLASRLADLFDQYQVYRSDWLALWAQGHDVLSHPSHPSRPTVALPPEQMWQAQLWRALMAQLNEQEQGSGRPMLHQKVVAHLQGAQPTAHPVARRVVAFGMTQLPQSVLQLLAAMAGRSQVLLAIPNPCRFHWGDIMDGRELHQQIRRQSPLRGGQDLAAVPLDALHLHAHPLLAAWGRQGRDFVRQTDAFDEQQQALGLPPVFRVDMFEESTPPHATLLQQVQAHIRDLLPLAEHPEVTVPGSDTSIVFHIAHSLVRELEVLHDHLLKALAAPGQEVPLQARDVVVMLPSIELAAPAIRAVFGQYRSGDARYIPFDIADLSTKAVSPLVLALEWVLHLPTQRCTQSELRDFLSQPSVAARLGLALEDLPRLMQWLSGAGVRWGLDARHRETLGLGLCGQANTGLFGLYRLLMGYAMGSGSGVNTHTLSGIEPYGEVGGLDAELAGAFAHLLEALIDWELQAQQECRPAEWATKFRALLAALFKAQNTQDQNHLAALDQALQSWLSACEQAQFDQPVALDVARAAWLDALGNTGLEQRFRAGGVTFCTMMPMRAIPFEVVCLLGMNEQDYPRRAHRSDFDLMALPGQFRPGDRARRDDDRQLMLEALLSARRQLLISWSGRSVRDNTEQAPSVLVAQLRDYLIAGWGAQVVSERSTEHPLQPFSRRYFEEGSELKTYAREWRAAHDLPEPAEPVNAPVVQGWSGEEPPRLSCDVLQNFLRNPVRAFFRQRLGVVFEALSQGDLDDEHFDLTGLDRFEVVRQLLDDCLSALMDSADPQWVLRQALGKMERAGQLPMACIGRRTVAQLQLALLPMLIQWQALGAQGLAQADRQHVRFTHGSLVLEDWLVCTLPGQWVRLEPMVLTETGKPDQVRVARVLQSWLISLLASANGTPLLTRLIGLDATVIGMPLAPEQARAHLEMVLDLWQQGMSEPLPLPFKTAWVGCQRPQDAATTYEGDFTSPGECQEPCLQRVFPNFETLVQDGRFEPLAQRLMKPLHDWVIQCVSVIPHSETFQGLRPGTQEAA